MYDDYGLSWAETMRDRREPPQSIEPKLHCSHCGKPIYEGEQVSEIYGEDLCPECVFELYGRYA